MEHPRDTLSTVPRSQDSVEIPTSYADSGLYRFSRVFSSNYAIEDVYHAALPVVVDCIHGVNGAILVRAFLFAAAPHAVRFQG